MTIVTSISVLEWVHLKGTWGQSNNFFLNRLFFIIKENYIHKKFQKFTCKPQLARFVKALARKEKNYVLHEWVYKAQCESGRTVSPSVVSVGYQGGGVVANPLKMFQYLAWITRCSLLKIIKLKLFASNKKLLL